MVTAALVAGKHVYCECPLGNGLAEAIELADLARRGNICTVIGLQRWAAPANQPSVCASFDTVGIRHRIEAIQDAAIVA